MKKTDLYLKPGTYIKASTTTGDVSGISLENFVVSVLNNPTCCPKPPGSPDGMLMTALPLNLTLQTVTDFVGNNSAIQLSTLRLGIRSDSSVTTQVSSVIQATTTNANLVIAPNGTGALIASIPDGTATGGNARGTNSVDLQTNRSNATQVASGSTSTIIGGYSNRSEGVNSTVIGGNLNNASGTTSIAGGNNTSTSASSSLGIGSDLNVSGAFGVCFGRQNVVSSVSSVVSGGQSNTASSGTYATVVGGQSNTASGQYSVAGGSINTVSQRYGFGIGRNNIVNGSDASAAIGFDNTTSGVSSIALGYGHTVNGAYSAGLGADTLTYLYGQISTASSLFANDGDAQQSLLTARRSAALNSAATTVLSLDGTGTTNLIIPNGNNRLWAVKVVATAFVSVAGGTLVLGDSYMGEFTLLFKRVGGTSSVVGVNAGNIIYDTNMATAAFTFAAGASQDLQITFKAPTTATATTFRCVAKVELVEVAY
jgi:hypothetical protein